MTNNTPEKSCVAHKSLQTTGSKRLLGDMTLVLEKDVATLATGMIGILVRNGFVPARCTSREVIETLESHNCMQMSADFLFYQQAQPAHIMLKPDHAKSFIVYRSSSSTAAPPAPTLNNNQPFLIITP
jgi:hypothetical protein